MLCGLNATCNDIIICICRVNWGVNCIDQYFFILKTTMELMMGRRDRKNTQDMSR